MEAKVQQYHRSRCRNQVQQRCKNRVQPWFRCQRRSTAGTACRPVSQPKYSNVTEASEEAEYIRYSTAASIEDKLPWCYKSQFRNQVQRYYKCQNSAEAMLRHAKRGQDRSQSNTAIQVPGSKKGVAMVSHPLIPRARKSKAGPTRWQMDTRPMFLWQRETERPERHEDQRDLAEDP